MDEELDIKEIVLALWKNKKFIICFTLIISLVVFIAYSFSNNVISNFENALDAEKLYYAETHFVVGTSETSKTSISQQDTVSESQIDISQRSRITQTDVLIETYGEIIKSKTSLENIINKLELEISVESLSSLISFSRVSESDYLSLTVAYKDQDKVIQIAEMLVEEFQKNMENTYPMDKVAIIDEPYLLTDSEISSSATASGITTSNSIAKSSLKSTIKYTLFAMVASFILSSCIILFEEMFTDRIKSKFDLEKITNSNFILSFTQHIMLDRNQFALLRVKLGDAKEILVTSAEQNNDLHYIADNLAEAFAKDLKKVILLDLTFDRPIVVKKYSPKFLLDFVTRKNADISKFVSRTTCPLYDYMYLDSYSNAYLNEAQLKKMLNGLSKLYDIVIIDSDNLLKNAHGLTMTRVIKNTIVAVSEENTTLDSFNKTVKSLNPESNTEYVWIDRKTDDSILYKEILK